MRDRVHSASCPFGIVSIRNCAHSELCPFEIVPIRDRVHLGSCHSGSCTGSTIILNYTCDPNFEATFRFAFKRAFMFQMVSPQIHFFDYLKHNHAINITFETFQLPLKVLLHLFFIKFARNFILSPSFEQYEKFV